MNKVTWLSFAEVLDAFRVIPRIIICAVYAFVAVYTYDFTHFYFKLIAHENVTDWKLTAYTAFGALTIPAVVGLATGMTKAYLDSGRSWKNDGS
jgi:hypothetical protein